MKDSPQFNIVFVALIEKYPCIYDFTSSDYSKKDVQEKAWETIAKEISETADDCKVRWKNLRGSYTRHLKALNGAKTKKPYYLAEYLNFLCPFTKTRKSLCSTSFPHSLISSPDIDNFQHEDNYSDEEEADESRTELDISPSGAIKLYDDGSRILASKKQKMNNSNSKYPIAPIAELTRAPLDYFEPKTILSTEMKTEDADLAFLKSVLPDMKEMNNAQKRRFKVGVLNLAGQILSE